MPGGVTKVRKPWNHLTIISGVLYQHTVHTLSNSPSRVHNTYLYIRLCNHCRYQTPGKFYYPQEKQQAHWQPFSGPFPWPSASSASSAPRPAPHFTLGVACSTWPLFPSQCLQTSSMCSVCHFTHLGAQYFI